MSLCRPAKCGCTITSGSLSIEAKPGGVGYNIETYEGVATESPDTRPALADRFDGMRVWTTDTKRLFAWNATSGEWIILSEPPQPVVGGDFVIYQGPSVVTKSVEYSVYQRHDGTFDWRGRITITGPGVAAAAIAITFPAAILPETALTYQGDCFLYDASANEYHIGMALANTSLQFIPLLTKGNAATHFGQSVTLAAGDNMMWHVWGVLL